MDDDFPFRVHRRRDGSVLVVTPEGDVDLRSAPAIRTEIEASRDGAATVVLDLRGVTFIDSTGVRLLVEAELAARREGFTFAVVRGPAAVDRLFDLAGLSDRLTLIDDPSQAAEPDDGGAPGR